MEINKQQPIKDMVEDALAAETAGRKLLYPNLIIIAVVGLLIVAFSVVAYVSPQLIGFTEPSLVVLLVGLLLGLTDIGFVVFVYIKLKKTAQEVDNLLKQQFEDATEHGANIFSASES